MDINNLENNEFLVECEVRNMKGKSVECYDMLLAQIIKEKYVPALLPNKAHLSARKNPKRELKICSDKLYSI